MKNISLAILLSVGCSLAAIKIDLNNPEQREVVLEFVKKNTPTDFVNPAVRGAGSDCSSYCHVPHSNPTSPSIRSENGVNFLNHAQQNNPSGPLTLSLEQGQNSPEPMESPFSETQEGGSFGISFQKAAMLVKELKELFVFKDNTVVYNQERQENNDDTIEALNKIVNYKLDNLIATSGLTILEISEFITRIFRPLVIHENVAKHQVLLCFINSLTNSQRMTETITLGNDPENLKKLLTEFLLFENVEGTASIEFVAPAVNETIAPVDHQEQPKEEASPKPTVQEQKTFSNEFIILASVFSSLALWEGGKKLLKSFKKRFQCHKPKST